MTTTKKDTSYTHEDSVEIDKKWNKITLNKQKREFIYSRFQTAVAEPVKLAEQAYKALGREVEKYYLESLMSIHGVPKKLITQEVMRRDKREPTLLPTSTRLQAVVKLTGRNKHGQTAVRHQFYCHGSDEKIYFVPWKDGSSSTITLPSNSPLGRKMTQAYDTEAQLREEYSSTCNQFSVLLNSCRNVGALLRQWPDAINYVPTEWKGNDIGKEIAPINMVDFDNSVKKMLNSTALLKEAGKEKKK